MFNTLPTRFRHYEVQKLLGSGNFGAVYLARDTDLDRLVVLKMLHAHLALQPEMVQRFLREARAMAKLDHTNIVRVNRVDASGDPSSRSSVRPMPFFEMEYVEGQTLAAYRRGRVLSLSEAMPILKQMAAALDVAHQQKIVHRDVKPANVLIKADGTVKLTDFGIIKLLESKGTLHASTGGIIGTPIYMAPEQTDVDFKHEIGPATDIYALGVVAYQLLTGRFPFEGSKNAVLIAHMSKPPPDPRTFNPSLSASVSQALLKVLSKQPSQRYPSAMAFVEALEQGTLEGSALPPPNTGTFASDKNTPTGPVTPPLSRPTPPVAPITPPLSSPTAAAAPTSQSAISKQMIIILLILVLLSILIAGVLRELFLTSTPTPDIGSTMQGRDGMTLLYVPAGEFLRGSQEGDPNTDNDERPQRSIYLDAFRIDQTEVTNGMYAACVNAGECRLPKTNRSFTRENYYNDPEYSNDPVIEISWDDARTYCEWVGRRLPTEAEWEKAARGTDGRIYPWGNERASENRLNFDRIAGDTTEVGDYSAGASPYGALDMAGNVWEWVADWYDAQYYNNAPERNPQGPNTGSLRVVRGGSWDDSAREVRAANRDRDDPTQRDDIIGFRCAVSP